MNCKRCSDGEATFCIGCMHDITTETDKALERAEARIAKLRYVLDFISRGGGSPAELAAKTLREGE